MSEKLSVQEQSTPIAEDLEREDWLKRYREARSATIASKFHENWRRTRLQEDGSYTPRIKETTDKDWIAAHGSNQVDIANTDYFGLPRDWQEENVAAARVIYDLVDNFRTRGMVVGMFENPAPAGTRVHEEWLGRNQWAAGGELDKPFVELPADEQAKDVEQVQIGRREFGYQERRAA
ncbi:MAG TPA: hypothetical protein VEH48_02155 [Candidatus Nitrosopolaris sp.]|nr:hypothetical protein [Candidatus Nitrosopolaris sp.]